MQAQKVKRYFAVGVALTMTMTASTSALAVGNRYDPNEDTQYYGSEYGQNLGLRDVSQVDENSMVTVKEGTSAVENADLEAYLKAQFGEDFDWEQIKKDYIEEGIYVISGSREINWDDFADLQPGDMADDTANHPVEVGGRLYVHMKDKSSPDKYYLLVSSTKDVEIGDSLFTDGEGGYGLLDDKYVATHMATSQEDGGEYSYFAHDLGSSGGKIGLQEAGSEGQKFIYVICETPGDYYQRLANEEAGYEERLEGQDRPYMPANNSSSTDGTWLNEWHNTKYSLSFSFENTAAEGEEPKLELADDYGLPVDAEALVGEATQGRDGNYSAEMSVDDLEALMNGDAFTVPVTALARDSSVNDGVIRTGGTEGDSNTRLGGYTNQLVKAQISGDEGVVEYDEETGILTGLKAGTAEVTLTVEEGRLTDRQSGEDLGQAYEGVAITLTITVNDGEEGVA